MGKRLTEWEKLKRTGSTHYKTASGVEPFDLMKAGGLLYPKSIADIIKYAYRCRPEAGRSTVSIIEDMDKVIHYATVVKALVSEPIVVKPKRKRRGRKLLTPVPFNIDDPFKEPEPADASKT